MQTGFATRVPRNVFQRTFPVFAATAYSLPSHDEKYATPPRTIGAGTIGPPVLSVHSGASRCAFAGEIPVSVDAFVRDRSCIGIGQASCAPAAWAIVERWAPVERRALAALESPARSARTAAAATRPRRTPGGGRRP